MTLSLHGVGIDGSRPVAIGEAFMLNREPSLVPAQIPAHQVQVELDRLDAALACARRHLEEVRRQIPAGTPKHIAEFIDAHLLMLADSALVDATRDLIRERSVNASWALQSQRDTLVEVFDRMEDAYLRTRRDDVDHVVRQIQLFLDPATDADLLGDADVAGRVIVAEDLTPADTILLRHRGVAAFVIEHGGPMSHTAILARSLDIPAVMGVHRAVQRLRQGELLVVDAETGTVLTELEPAILEHYRARLANFDAHRRELRRLVREPSATRDGVPVVLLANLELPEDVAAARDNGAAGVGLYRTEFLYMNRDALPDEEEHLETYLGIIRGLDGIPLTIRTLDLGADKQIPDTSFHPARSNPALGLRAIRLCLQEPALFLPQLRAILRASAYGPVRIMIPMISCMAEVNAVLGLIAEARREMRRERVAFDPLMPVGGMIEVPAAALMAGALARRLDFLSIGTNDLIQYTLAIDRVDDTVSYLYDPLHPAVIRLIKHVIDAAASTRTRVSMCGEMAGDPRYTPLLLGLGLRELSMQPGSLLEVKDRVRRCDLGALARTVADVVDHIDEMPAQVLLDKLEACVEP
ncbi:MAG: phosphoenolpyruvate--protein phosphotransferase [Thiohalocapsa sp.]|jgi:phosphotransferase system enzyme I (PtsI)|uniref:phosphoenolpyruvate--protein phosphotransferase n=1 Tax=Thiohalocapsa sp. TaxID=2497641 RepID=UPI0025E4525E|nr:phosphoenolpyruvate--protein phosphotransferase [Thiohalocapsa sp.]MCG6943440.1 phosphoenolpyruvate--protein phosphotransferase [Thiohalocapsa sp.]